MRRRVARAGRQRRTHIADMIKLLNMFRFNAAGLVAAIGLLMLGAALAFQYWGALEPCNLCIEQRKAWAAAVILATLALFAEGKSTDCAVALALLALAGVAVLIGAGGRSVSCWCRATMVGRNKSMRCRVHWLRPGRRRGPA